LEVFKSKICMPDAFQAMANELRIGIPYLERPDHYGGMVRIRLDAVDSHETGRIETPDDYRAITMT
jgi:hypothetical protein